MVSVKTTKVDLGASWRNRRETGEVGLHSNLCSTVGLSNSQCSRTDDRYGSVEKLLATVPDLRPTNSTLETNTPPREHWGAPFQCQSIGLISCFTRSPLSITSTVALTLERKPTNAFSGTSHRSTALWFRWSTFANQRWPSFQRRNPSNPYTLHGSSRSCSCWIELSEIAQLTPSKDRCIGRTDSSNPTRTRLVVPSRSEQWSDASR